MGADTREGQVVRVQDGLAFNARMNARRGWTGLETGRRKRQLRTTMVKADQSPFHFSDWSVRWRDGTLPEGRPVPGRTDHSVQAFGDTGWTMSVRRHSSAPESDIDWHRGGRVRLRGCRCCTARGRQGNWMAEIDAGHHRRRRLAAHAGAYPVFPSGPTPGTRGLAQWHEGATVLPGVAAEARMGRTGMAAWLRDGPGGQGELRGDGRRQRPTGGTQGKAGGRPGFRVWGHQQGRGCQRWGAPSLDGPRRGRCGTPLACRAAVRCGSGRAADPQEAGSGAGWATEGSAGGGSSSDR
jgi:hypothetical protein